MTSNISASLRSGDAATISPAVGHTPGPWRVVEADLVVNVRAEILNSLPGIQADRICRIGWWSNGMGPSRAVALANARLIAAAPDLLEACQRTLEMLESIEAKTLVGDEGCLWGVEIARYALAKAKGE